MARILIAVESTDPERKYDHLGERFGERGDDCQVLDSVWILRTDDSPEEISSFLLDGIVHPSDRFIVAPLSATWVPFNAPSEDDCIEYQNTLRQANKTPVLT